MSNTVKIVRWGCILAAVPVLAALSAGSAPADESATREQVAEGARLYGMYCAACHGEKARGNGPTASMLKTRPTDLTRLTKKNDKQFPAERVHDAIDGRGLEHGTRDMPLWGLAFQNMGSDANQEPEVEAHIDALVAWIESIQR